MLDQQTAPSRRGPGTRALAGATELGDEELAIKARNDRDAFAVLYRRHVRAVYAYAFRATGSPHIAEEVTSATFEKALRAMPRFEWRGGGFRAWLLRIAASEIVSWYRRQSRDGRPRGQLALRDLAGSDRSATESSIDLAADSAVIRASLATLPPRYHEAISLRFLAGLSSQEAARAMGCSAANFAVTLHRALGALRQRIGGDLDGTF